MPKRIAEQSENIKKKEVKLSDGCDCRAALAGASPARDIVVPRIGVGFKAFS